MQRRQLRVVATGRVVGAVALKGDRVSFEGAAADVFGGARVRQDDLSLVRRLLAEGWSNGYLYLAE